MRSGGQSYASDMKGNQDLANPLVSAWRDNISRDLPCVCAPQGFHFMLFTEFEIVVNLISTPGLQRVQAHRSRSKIFPFILHPHDMLLKMVLLFLPAMLMALALLSIECGYHREINPAAKVEAHPQVLATCAKFSVKWIRPTNRN